MKQWDLSHDKSSKWYLSDKMDFQSKLRMLDVAELKYKLNQLSSLNSINFEKKVNKEINKLDKAGMFNLGNMSPVHQLD
jgi:hypothetical protein